MQTRYAFAVKNSSASEEQNWTGEARMKDLFPKESAVHLTYTSITETRIYLSAKISTLIQL